MFGYLSMHSYFHSFKMHRCYANYYCGTCFGLEHNYGQFSRLLLSNDVSLLGILLKCHKNSLGDRYLCFGKCKEKHCLFYGGEWEQLAAINLLLINEKLKDDVNDERSLKAMFGMFLLSGRFKKAQKTFPKMAEAISRGYKEIYQLEKAGSGIRPIEECFADMMVNTMSECRDLEAWEIDYIRHISRWIYYIDALDDYEDDFRDGIFNALKKEDAPTLYEYTKKHMPIIMEDLQYIYRDLENILEKMPQVTTEDKLLKTLICDDIPLRTAKVLSGRKLNKLKIGSVWEGSNRTS